MIIAECPYCGARFYGWAVEEVLEKYKHHRCKAEWVRDNFEELKGKMETKQLSQEQKKELKE